MVIIVYSMILFIIMYLYDNTIQFIIHYDIFFINILESIIY